MPPPITNNNLNYKTFDQLLAGIESDIDKFADEGYINRAIYIKEVRKVNADLGLKINTEREWMMDVKDYVGLLPPDFLFLQLAMACHTSYVRVPIIRGIQTEMHSEEITLEGESEIPTSCFLKSCDFGDCPDSPCDKCMWVTQKIGVRVYNYTDLKQLQLTKSSLNKCTDTCFNHMFKSPHQIKIEDDHATFSFREGKVYLNYLADMLDQDNNVLVLDHPLVNDYYEYAVKKKFFENMYLNKEGDFVQAYQAMKGELLQARTRAITFVNTPEYGDIQKMFIDNRHRFYKKYIHYFENRTQGYYKGEPHDRRYFGENGPGGIW